MKFLISLIILALASFSSATELTPTRLISKAGKTQFYITVTNRFKAPANYELEMWREDAETPMPFMANAFTFRLPPNATKRIRIQVDAQPGLYLYSVIGTPESNDPSAAMPRFRVFGRLGVERDTEDFVLTGTFGAGR